MSLRDLHSSSIKAITNYFEFKKYSELKIWLMHMFKAYTSTILQHMYSNSSTILDFTEE